MAFLVGLLVMWTLPTSPDAEAAGTPPVSVSDATNITPTSATLHGTVTATALVTTHVQFQYKTTTSNWASTPVQDIKGGVTAKATAVSANIGSLAHGTTYSFRLYAYDGLNNSNTSSTSAFTTVSTPPVVSTGTASNVTTSSATIGGTVDPNGLSTQAHFEYGTTTDYGTSTAPQDMGSDNGGSPITAALSGLSPGTTYHFRVVATNDNGSDSGSDQTFTTASPPMAATGGPTSVSPSGATLSGVVNPSGAPTTVTFQYGTSTSYGSTTSQQDMGSGTDTVGASTSISNLKPNTTYHYRIVAISANGTVYGDDQKVRTLESGAHPTTLAASTPTLSLSRSSFAATTTSTSAAPSSTSGTPTVSASPGSRTLRAGTSPSVDPTTSGGAEDASGAITMKKSSRHPVVAWALVGLVLAAAAAVGARMFLDQKNGPPQH